MPLFSQTWRVVQTERRYQKPLRKQKAGTTGFLAGAGLASGLILNHATGLAAINGLTRFQISRNGDT